MAILPLQLARVSNALRMNLAQSNLTRTQQALVNVQNQLATGKRLNLPSDDPADAAIAQQLRKTLEQRAAYAANLKFAASHLSEVDTTLGDLTDLLRQAQTIASANVGSVVSPDERAAAAAVVEKLFDQAVSLGNKQFLGTYLFAGDRADQQPFTPDLGGIRFTGSETQLQNRYDESAVLPFMANGSEIFGALSSRVKGTADLTPALTLSTRLSDLRGAVAQGVVPGAILLGNGAVSRAIDLSHADTIGDVVDAINAAAVGGITASIAPDGNSLLLSASPADNITVTELGSTTARDLGILTATPPGLANPVDGQNLSLKLSLFTRLSDLRGGSGIDQTGGLLITNGPQTATVSLASASTLEDLLNVINSSGAGVLARINADATGIDVLNSVQGVTLTIAENGGATATDLGIRSFAPASLLSQLNAGNGVRTAPGPDLRITRRDGTEFQVDLDNAPTVQDVIDAINAADAGGGLTASFASTGNAIVLTDSTTGSSPLTVTALNYSHALADLGLDVPASGNTLTSRDVNGVQAAGLFGNLANLREALLHNDQDAITESAAAIQHDLDRVVRLRGQVGVQTQDFESRQERLDDQNLATQTLLSSLEDADYNEAITRFQTLQTALQANLQTTGSLLNLSLLDFLG
jgi:flagellar hook-associated protein 3 FlgL